MKASTWRLLRMGETSAARNMALDHALLRCASFVGIPTLRLYGWSAKALSYGYFTEIEEEVDVAACRRLGIQLVRRPTGGGVVLHEGSATYTVVMPPGFLPPDVLSSYRLLNAGVVKALRRLGFAAESASECHCSERGAPDWCLLRTTPHDVVCGGFKLAGAAQRRTRSGTLYQGYVTLQAPDEVTLALARNEALRHAAVSLASFLNPPLSEAKMRTALLEGFAEALSIRWELSSLTDAEFSDAERLCNALYENDAWNLGDRALRQRLRQNTELETAIP